LLPAFYSCEHAFWVSGPYEGFGIGVCVCDEAVDGDWQINDRSEHAALEALARESLNCFGRFGNRPNESDH
jgi:hypothetical protein